MSASPTKNPVELLERYLYAVRFWLPKKQQDDIVSELSEDLHSQIEEKEAELSRPLNQAEVEEILRHCGSPIMVASRYQPPTQLIGPVLFPLYKFVLKMVLLWILVPVFIVIIGPAIVLPARHLFGALLETLSTLGTALFVAASVITIIFATLERTQTKLHLFEKWDCRSLPPVAAERKKKPSLAQNSFEALFAFLGLLWLLAVPHSPFLVLGPFAAFLKFAPVWHEVYKPLILLSLAGLFRQALTLARPRRTWLTPAARLLTTALTLILLNVIIHAASTTPRGDWNPYVLATKSSAQQIRVAAIVNVNVLLTLVCAYLGLAIAALIQTWQLLRHFRKESLRKQQTTAPQAT